MGDNNILFSSPFSLSYKYPPQKMPRISPTATLRLLLWNPTISLSRSLIFSPVCATLWGMWSVPGGARLITVTPVIPPPPPRPRHTHRPFTPGCFLVLNGFLFTTVYMGRERGSFDEPWVWLWPRLQTPHITGPSQAVPRCPTSSHPAAE